MKALYFGCVVDRWQVHGHHLFAAKASGDTTVETIRYRGNNPWGDEIDGGLCPGGRDHRGVEGVEQIEGRALIHRKAGWTALAFWDRSADIRPNSCSVFMAEGDHDFAGMVRIAETAFPSVIARFKFQIVPAAKPGLAEVGAEKPNQPACD